MSRILVIDDEALLRLAMSRMLQDAGHEVIVGADGEEGLHYAAAAPPDLVITDIIMPRKDGIETIRCLRSIFPDLPIIAISGGSRSLESRDLLRQAMVAGANEVLAKPFLPGEFMRAVTVGLRLGSRTREAAVG